MSPPDSEALLPVPDVPSQNELVVVRMESRPLKGSLNAAGQGEQRIVCHDHRDRISLDPSLL